MKNRKQVHDEMMSHERTENECLQQPTRREIERQLAVRSVSFSNWVTSHWEDEN